MKLESFHHICIQTEDYHASKAFYINLLGFQIVKEVAGFHTRAFNTWLKGPGMMIELQTPKAGTNFLEWNSLNGGPVHVCFEVDDVKEAYEFLKNKDYHNFKQKNGQELYEVMGSSLFKVKAPEGTEIEIRMAGSL